ncbi:hypothetical protein Ddye_014452 [Dipteronia dyeriana]|uniref:FLZ-type domain-containing protein n=1 Tax=Dipteronia dyeriana TaxID=168575 RepID=A0AAE0CKM1_9ROSI|nr:hypothetical protein Ddye_014452 [Dipteronia dyeriana]
MLPKFTSAFKVEEEENGKGSRSSNTRSSTFGGSCSSKKGNSTSLVVGLKILVVQISKGRSNIVIKPTLIKHSSSKSSSASQTHQYSCFLKSCFLCNKNLSLDNDVYMYRGDQGFCSIECRSRQIILDDMSELETSTKKMVAFYRSSNSCSKSDRRETQVLLQELRHQRHHNKQHNYNQKIQWVI